MRRHSTCPPVAIIWGAYDKLPQKEIHVQLLFIYITMAAYTTRTSTALNMYKMLLRIHKKDFYFYQNKKEKVFLQHRVLNIYNKEKVLLSIKYLIYKNIV